MGLTTLEQTVLTYSQKVYKHPDPTDIPGNTPFVTGNLVVDHFLNLMTVDHGIRITLKRHRGYQQIDRAEVVDEAKAMWFLMKYK